MLKSCIFVYKDTDIILLPFLFSLATLVSKTHLSRGEYMNIAVILTETRVANFLKPCIKIKCP